MSSSIRPDASAWAPQLDLSTTGLARLDPTRIEQAVEDGYRSGYEAGHEAGHAEAMAAGERAVATEIERFRTDATAVVDALASTHERLATAEEATGAAFAATVVDAAVRLASAVIARELADETTAAVAAVERSLATLGRRPGVVVQLHPEDITLLDEATLPAGVEVEPNPGLARGDAIASTDDRTVDARIGAALERALAALTGDAA